MFSQIFETTDTEHAACVCGPARAQPIDVNCFYFRFGGDETL